MVRGTGIAASGAVLSPRRWHLVLGGILAASLALDLVPLWWDLASANGWAPDEIHPSELNRAARHGFSAWASRYPPFHYYLLSVSFQAFSAAASWVGMVPQDLDDYHRWLFVVGRVISSLMATGTVYVVYRCARCLYPRGAACGAALSVALMPPIVYYAKTMNLEAPYVFWFSISVFFLLRILQRQRLRDYLLLAATTAFAIGSKDQAYGLYLLVPVVLVGSLAAWRKRREPGFRVAALLVDRRLVGGLLLSLLLFALIHRVPFDPVGFSKHLDAMRAVAAPAREFDATLGGNFDLARQSLRNTVFALGAPLSLLSLAGLVLAAARPYRNWRVLALLPLPLSYQLFFIDLVGYSYARFMIPVCVILSLFVAHALREAQRALAALVEPKIERAVLAGLAIAIFGHALLRASSVDLVMIAD
ncbi:MAG: glycosyltransferase family 39 protein, partial [Thermoanaerobaculia bacterium]|nr:glycosyltransferase family 39 protein [Thermoanaerobaculia bacterium]